MNIDQVNAIEMVRETKELFGCYQSLNKNKKFAAGLSLLYHVQEHIRQLELLPKDSPNVLLAIADLRLICQEVKQIIIDSRD